MKKDPESKKYKSCPMRCCNGTDIRVHFTERDGKPMSEKYHLHWCVKCGIGHNSERGFMDAMIFGSCVEQMDEQKKKVVENEKIN